ncbi:MAG: NUDIX hydrolase [Candidatus Nanoarchaeia archaeon]
MNFHEEVACSVDSQDNLLGSINRKDEVFGKHILRSASVFVQNISNNNILLQQRSKHSKKYPLHWDISGGGHVNYNESYEECAKRELFEEVGIKANSLQLLGKHFFVLDNNRKRFSCSFVAKINDDNTLNIDNTEVEQVKWLSIEEIKQMIQNREPFHPECKFLLETYIL